MFQAGFQANKGKFLVGAIDFGTTYSGWAYSFLNDYRSDPTKAIVRLWNSGTDTLVTEKTPTCALIAPDGKTLVAFGYEAEDKYQKLVEKGTYMQYYFFKRFKMALDKQVSSEHFNFISKPLFTFYKVNLCFKISLEMKLCCMTCIIVVLVVMDKTQQADSHGTCVTE